jgi:hypothetical protein
MPPSRWATRCRPTNRPARLVILSGESQQADYVEKYSAVALQLVKQRYLLRPDAHTLIAQAKAVTSIPD